MRVSSITGNNNTTILYVQTYPYFDVICQNYPKNRHPGWNKGSVAYHAGQC